MLCRHGGPGSGCGPNVRRYFDPEAYRIIVFDQRGAGKSKPSSELKVEVERVREREREEKGKERERGG